MTNNRDISLVRRLSALPTRLPGACVFFLALATSPVHSADEVVRPQIQIETGAHAAPVRRLAVSVAKGIALTASDDKTARIWDLATGRLRTVLRPSIGADQAGRLYGAAIHPTSAVVAIAGTIAPSATGATGQSTGDRTKSDNIILRLSSDTGQLIDTIAAHGGEIKHLAYSPDGKTLFASYAGDHGLRAFDARGEMIFEQQFDTPAYGLDVSPQGLVAVTEMRGRVHLYQSRTGSVTPVRIIESGGRLPVSVAFSPDDSQLVIGFFAADADTGEAEVIDVASGRSRLRLALPARREGNLMSVGWSPDGSRIVAAGTAYIDTRTFSVHEYAADTGEWLREHRVANNSITDLLPVAGSQIAFTSFDGSWGTLDLSTGSVRSTGGNLADLRGPGRLLISPDARRIGFDFDFGATPAWFDLGQRLLTLGEAPTDLAPAPIRSGFFSKPRWENVRRVEVNGATLELASDEVGRSLTTLTDSNDAVLGSSKALYRIGPDGTVRWRIPMAAEVLAINVSADSRLLVGALSDGTIRWWQAVDGNPLLALMPQRTRQWVVWTPGGLFDASVGADRNVGWAVNRSDAPLADFFSLNRFREGFNDPQAIDQALTPGVQRRKVGPAPVTVAPVTKQAIESPTPLRFPPVLASIGATTLDASGQTIAIPFTLQAVKKAQLEVRINGRPTESAAITLPLQLDGRTAGRVAIPAPLPGSVVQLIASDENGVSEPLGFELEDITAGQVSSATPSATQSAAPSAPVPAQLALQALQPLPVLQAPPVTSSGSGETRTKRARDLPGPKLFVLSIGISNFVQTQYQLGLAAKDSRDFVTTMSSQQGRYYSQVIARTLNDAQASRHNILDSLRWLSESVGPDDVGMLFMAGHGINALDGQYYFMPYEGNHEELATTGVPEASIRNTLGRMKGRAIFFVDTCYAGNALGNFENASRELAGLANDLAAAENGVIVFASSSGRQLSEENDAWGNGAFTKALIAGLSGQADLTNTGRITYKGLDYFISEEVSKLTEGRQTPVTISPVGVPDFAIAKT